MKADFSHFRFNLNKGYTRVLQQQGRVTLDSDWNEQVSIQADLDHKRLQDIIGHCGVPYGDAGFLVNIVPDGADYDLVLSAGTIYVAGRRVDLDDTINYSAQPFLPNPTPVSDPGATNRVDLVYLCVRERHITYLEDDAIREIALGGPDTTTRVQTIWQVHVAEDVSLTRCQEDASNLMGMGVGAGLLTTLEDPVSVDDDPCVTPADSSYRGLENRLYRVEVHQGGTVAGGASIKWSRYNGAVAFNVLSIEPGNQTLSVARLGWDQILTLATNSWIELISEEDELAGIPGVMLQITQVNEAQREITVNDAGGDLATYISASNVRVRLWNTSAIALNTDFDATTKSTEITLEDGIKVEIAVNNSGDFFRTSDYWTFTARTITGSVEELTAAPPQGQEWYCCKLGLLHWDAAGGGTVTIEDCRPMFPALTEMLQLHYASGDGQEGMPGDTLEGPLMVRVSRGEHPVQNVPIVFNIMTMGLGGKVFTVADPTGGDEIVVYTDASGFATCQWQLGSNRNRYHQRVKAHIDAPGGARDHQQVNFNANLSIAEEVSYEPPKGCTNIDASVKTVAEALDALCEIPADGVTYTPPENCPTLDGTTTVREALDALCNITGTDDPAFHVVGIFWLLNGSPSIHDQPVPLDVFINGLRIRCDAEPDPRTIKKASVFITLELPVKTLPGVQLSYILDGTVDVSGKDILWKPSTDAQQFLTRQIEQVARRPETYLARLFLKGSKIGSVEDPRIHLDGDVVNLPDTPHNLLLPSGDGEQGGDFEMWFWLTKRDEPGPSPAEGLIRWAIGGIDRIMLLDPVLVVDSPDVLVMDLLYAGLVKLDVDGTTILPDLAESWIVEEENSAFTFYLRDGISFSDGTPITSEDVVMSLERARTMIRNGPSYLYNIDTFEIFDDLTLKINLVDSSRSRYFLHQLTTTPARIVSKQALINSEGTFPLDNAVTSGAFTVDSSTEHEITLIPNEFYWQPAGVQEIELLYMEQSQAIAAFEAADLEVVGGVQHPVSAQTTSLEVIGPDLPACAVRYIGFNHFRESENGGAPSYEALFRRALALLIDWGEVKRVVEELKLGYFGLEQRILPPCLVESDLDLEDSPYEFNPERAQELLDELGYPAPLEDHEFTLRLALAEFDPVLEIVINSWRAFGIRVEEINIPNLRDFSLYLFDNVNNYLVSNQSPEFDVYYSFWKEDYHDTQNILSQQLHSVEMPQHYQNNGLYPGLEGDGIDDLIDSADARATAANAAQEYRDAERVALQDVAWIPLYYPTARVLKADFVQGLEITGRGFVIPDFSALKGRI